MTVGKPLRVLVAVSPGALMPEGPGWWTQISAFTSIALSAVVIGAAVFLLLNLRRQKRALLDSAGTYVGSLRRRREADDRAEWIRRTQWALGAAASSNDTRHFYGISILEALARSDLTGPEDKATLDTVWAGTCTKLRDSEIRQLLAEYEAFIEREKVESIPEFSPKRAVGRQNVRGESLASRPNEASRRSSLGNYKDFDSERQDKIFATLRREILAARLKVTLDEQLGRKTSPIVTHLAGMNLPPIGRGPGVAWR